MVRLRLSFAALALFGVAASSAAFADDAPAPDQAAKLEFFEKKVRPLLVDNCYNCHSADHKAAGGLRVDDHRGLLRGGGRGAAVVPGKPGDSVLLRAVRQTDAKLKMPPDYKLEDEQIAILERWVADGAVWPAQDLSELATKENPEYEALRKNHWAWQPLATPAVPAVKRADWAWGPVDSFLLSTLEANNLEPVADADRATWLRRVTFDLTGLPPTPEELRAFLADDTAAAHEKVVDRLLDSPAFGERWGRHWLDVARYGESTGSARNLPYPQAWKYRDYVIDAFNKDKPYDRFIREQIAGDLLPAETEAQRKEQTIATGFLALGVKDVNQRFKVRFEMDNIDEQIDTVSRSVLGLTVSCARCHDHKFDPITQSEYYALAGIFQSTDLCAGLRNQMGGAGLAYYDTSKVLILAKSDALSPEQAAKAEELKEKVEAARLEFVRLRDSDEGAELAKNGRPKRQQARQKWNRLQAELNALTDPAATGETALGVRDSKEIGDTEIRIRGEAEQLGPVVPRGFLKLVDVPASGPIPADQSGRLQLAEWLTSPRNPLTARVVANRVWHHLFGAGLVRSVDNFGTTSDTPSHPELLDHLANRFIADGWSVKKHIRLLVLSHAYRLGSGATEGHLEKDPANRLVWRHSPRRLTGEELRDATLAAAHRLDFHRPQGSAAQKLPVVELRNNGPESQRIVEAGRASRSRSVYLPLVRTIVPTSLEVFDFADQGLVTGSRETTTVPTQALYLLNDEFVRKNALALAETLLESPQLDDAGRIERAYLLALGRVPSPSEIDRARYYLADFEAQAAGVGPVAEDEPEPAADAAKPENVETPAVAANDQQQVNADDVDQTESRPREEIVRAKDGRAAAWASFVQALFGSGEFRYVR